MRLDGLPRLRAGRPNQELADSGFVSEDDISTTESSSHLPIEHDDASISALETPPPQQQICRYNFHILFHRSYLQPVLFFNGYDTGKLADPG